MPDYPSGTVAFLFTDIEESTRRWETAQSAMWAAVERHFELLRAAIDTHQGVLFKTVGDAVQAAFPSVPQAIGAASLAQTSLRQEDWGPIGPLRVRMAIHVGEAIPQQGDYLAPALNRLSRVLSAGYGDQILLTEAARALATTLPDAHGLKDLGQHRLRDLLEPERIYQLTGPGLADEFPPLKTIDVRPNNLPAQPTALIGRETEVAQVAALIDANDCRIITLTGPGGTGKTRLALQAAAESLEIFPDGVWWVPLASITDPALVPGAIATAIGLREVAGENLAETLSEYLRSRGMLLLLDNVEQVIDTAPLLARLVDTAPRLVVLATSREPLRLRAEREYPVDPLPLPARRGKISLAAASASPAVQVFVERARAVKPGFILDTSNVDDIVAICRQLDGLPLAIELAAARIRILTPAALLARLDRRLSLLTGGARDLPARQQTLRATIEWSHDLLDPAEQELFARLGVFAGGCTFETAEAVCASAPGLELDCFDGMDSLVQKSLLRQEVDAAGDMRFTMLQTIREYSRERLQDLPVAREIETAHAETFLALAEGADWLDLSQQARLLDRFEADHANFRQAIAHFESLGPSGLPRQARLVASLAHFWWVRGHLSEGRQFLDRVVPPAEVVDPTTQASALWGAALLAEAQGELERAEQLHEEALALRRETNDLFAIARSLTGLGVIARQRGELSRARELHQEALATWREAGDAAGVAGSLFDLGVVELFEGDYDEAEPTLIESLTLFQQLGDPSGEASVLQSLGFLAMSTGNQSLARDRFEQSLLRWRELGNQQMIATDLANLGESRHLAGSLDEARSLFEEALALYDSLGDPGGQGFVLSQLGWLSLDLEQLAEARRFFVDSLRFRWSAGERGATADTLEGLAEAHWRLGEPDVVWKFIAAASVLREETSVARQPVYEARYQTMLQAIGAQPVEPHPVDVELTVELAIKQRREAPLGVGVRGALSAS